MVALAIEGTMLDSVELASQIEKWGVSGIIHLAEILEEKNIALNPLSWSWHHKSKNGVFRVSAGLF